MSYENPPVPHEVNVSRESALIEFLRLVAGLSLCAAVIAAVLWATGGWLARHLPFSAEASMVGDTIPGLELVGSREKGSTSAALDTYLDELALKLAAGMALPEGMRVRVHAVDADVANAFATLGGHVVITRGLYTRMPTENALAFVLAHEIAHLRERDPISAVGGGASVALTFALLGGDVGGVLPQVARLVTLGYSRAAETRADSLAIAALHAAYGHARDADAAMRALADSREPTAIGAPPTLLSTHPADTERIARLEAAAAAAPSDAIVVPVRVAWSSANETERANAAD